MGATMSPLPFKGGDQGVGAIAAGNRWRTHFSIPGGSSLTLAPTPNPSLEREGLK
jgi:hypothetical protein